MFCDMCNLAVHQDCYGVPYIPEGQWLCRRCQLSPSAAVQCALCPNGGGAFKQTSDEGRWCHVVCAIWVPEVHFANTVFLEPVEGLSSVPPARWRLRCMVCKQKEVGACIQCHKPSCYAAFHVTCAQSAGVYMKVVPCGERSPGRAPYAVRKYIYCGIHAPPTDSEQEDVDDDDDLNNVKAKKKKPTATPIPMATPLDARLVQKRKNKQLVKIRHARRLLAKNKTATPVVAVPVVPIEKLEGILAKVEYYGRTKFFPRLVAYWLLKRESRFGVPLLKRLQVYHKSTSASSRMSQAASVTGGTAAVIELNKTRALRQNLERARILCELLRKRERLKRDYIALASDWAEMELRPMGSLMAEVVDLLITKDRYCVFTQPVSEEDVPGYGQVVTRPMDLSTIRKKVDSNFYKNFGALREDYRLMIDNCLKFNANNAFYWKYAMRMKRIGYKVLGRFATKTSGKSGTMNNTSFGSKPFHAVAFITEKQLSAEMMLKRFADIAAVAEESEFGKKMQKADELQKQSQTAVKLSNAAARKSTLPTNVGRKRAANSTDDKKTHQPAPKKQHAAAADIPSTSEGIFSKFRVVESVPKSPAAVSTDASTSASDDDDDDSDILVAGEDGDDDIFVTSPTNKRKGRRHFDLGRLSSNGRPVRSVGARKGVTSPSRKVSALLPKHWDLVWVEHPTIPAGNPKKWTCCFPALVYDPRMPKNGLLNAFGMRLHAPPADVLALDPMRRKEVTSHFLVRFFDVDHTWFGSIFDVDDVSSKWHWALIEKMTQFGLDDALDDYQLERPRQQQIQKAIRAAHREALYYRYRLTEISAPQYADEFAEREEKDKEDAEKLEAALLKS